MAEAKLRRKRYPQEPDSPHTRCEEEIVWPYLRAQRHAWLNRLQEIVGWMQLGRHEYSERALERFRQRLAAENELARCLPAPLAGWLLGQAVLTEARGIKVELEVRAAVPVRVAGDWSTCRRRLQAGWDELVTRLMAGGGPSVLRVRWEGCRLELTADGSDRAWIYDWPPADPVGEDES